MERTPKNAFSIRQELARMIMALEAEIALRRVRPMAAMLEAGRERSEGILIAPLRFWYVFGNSERQK